MKMRVKDEERMIKRAKGEKWMINDIPLRSPGCKFFRKVICNIMLIFFNEEKSVFRKLSLC